MNKTLGNRLDRLAARLLPSGPPLFLQIVYVSSDGRKENGPLLQVGGGTPTTAPKGSANLPKRPP